MPKKDGHLTRETILKVAETLFSENGFDGTSVNAIAKMAGVNKSLIYYHFKDKNDLIRSLIERIMVDIEKMTGGPYDAAEQKQIHLAESHSDQIYKEIKVMEKWKRIISVMLMESLKDSNEDSFLFDCAAMVYNRHLGIEMADTNPEIRKEIVYEFFTGFIPLISFISLQDKWCRHFKYPLEELRNDFFEAFQKTHLRHHS